jgi:hypothetical protein
MSDDVNKFQRLAAPPAPMFTNQKERDFVKQINDELTERVIGQQVLYYPIDHENTNWNIYNEAPEKSFLSPIQCYALVVWEGLDTVFEDDMGADKRTRIIVRFQRRRISEDKNLLVREGDFILRGDTYYEIQSVGEPSELFGQPDQRFEVEASCLKAREGVFDAS